jgi:hypothetical protein
MMDDPQVTCPRVTERLRTSFVFGPLVLWSLLGQGEVSEVGFPG